MTFAVTGMGAVSQLGLTAERHLALLAEPHGLPQAGAAQGVSATSLLGAKGTQFVDRATALAVYAARAAIDQADIASSEDELRTVGLVLGSSNGSIASIATMTRDTYVRSPPYHVSPMEFPNTVMNAPAGQCAIRHELRGLNATVSGGNLSGLCALQYAIEKLRLGYAPSLLVGAVEEHGEEAQSWQARARKLRGSRPLPIGEGGVFVHLERLASAQNSSRRINFEILACATGFDPALAQGGQSGILAKVAKNCLTQGGASHEDIDVVVLGELGHPPTDAYEAWTMDQIFGERRPLVVSPTRVLGDTMSALNFFQVLAGLAALSGRTEETRALVLAAEPGGRIGALFFKRPAAASTEQSQ